MIIDFKEFNKSLGHSTVLFYKPLAHIKHGVGNECLGVLETGILECHVGAYLELGMLLSYGLIKFSFEVLSLNTCGLGDYKKWRKVVNFLQKQSLSKTITLLQETYSSKVNEDVWINQWGCGRDKLIFSHGESNVRGVMIAVHEYLDIKVTSIFQDNNGCFIILYEEKPFVLVNYYAPNDEGDQDQTLSEINSIIDKIDIEISTSIIWGETSTCTLALF